MYCQRQVLSAVAVDALRDDKTRHLDKRRLDLLAASPGGRRLFRQRVGLGGKISTGRPGAAADCRGVDVRHLHARHLRSTEPAVSGWRRLVAEGSIADHAAGLATGGAKRN